MPFLEGANRFSLTHFGEEFINVERGRAFLCHSGSSIRNLAKAGPAELVRPSKVNS